MINRKKSKKTSSKPYSEEFKTEAIKLADKIGATAAAEESTSDAEKRLMAENAKLKRELLEQKDENLF